MKSRKISLGWGTLVLVALGICWLGLFTLTSRAQQETKTPATPGVTTETESPTTPPERVPPSGRRRIMGASLLIGKALYAFEELGTNGKSCKSCHQQGMDTKGQPWKRKQGETYMDGKMSLVKAINTCITTRQNGTALPAGGTEMKSLVLYVSSLQK